MVVRWAPGLESERAGREKLEESAGGELVRLRGYAAASLRGNWGSVLVTPTLCLAVASPSLEERESDIGPKFGEVCFFLVTSCDRFPASRGSTWGHWLECRETWVLVSVLSLMPRVTLDESLSGLGVPMGKTRLICSPFGFWGSLCLFPRSVRRFVTARLSGILLQVVRLKAARKWGSYLSFWLCLAHCMAHHRCSRNIYWRN